jgi:hypothetical protein
VLTAAGVAVAVAFFILFAAMSVGLGEFIDGELGRPRTLHLYLESGSPTPFDDDDLEFIELVVEQSLAGSRTQRWTVPRMELPITQGPSGEPLRLWGVQNSRFDAFITPPYDPDAALQWGRHLQPADFEATGGAMPCVLGASAMEALFPQSSEGRLVSIGPDGTVDPWWMPEATDYPLEGKVSVWADPRGPVEARLVGSMEPGQGDVVDWSVFVPLLPLIQTLGQYDWALERSYYQQVVVTVGDGSQIDLSALEANIALQLPGIEGTDDAWDRDSFEEAYESTSGALDGWLMVVTMVMGVMLVAGVSDTTLVAVADRRREIATLRAVGLRSQQVSRLVLVEVMILAVVGLVVGVIAGSGLALLFGHLHETTGGSGIFLAPVSIDPWVLLGAVALALGTAALAAAYPARRAAREPPTEALRYE